MINRTKAKNNSNENSTPAVFVQIGETGLMIFNGRLVDIERLSALIESLLSENQQRGCYRYDEVTHKRAVMVIDSISSFKKLTISIGK